MTDDSEQARRQRRLETAERFHREVQTWSSRKLRANLAQPDQVRAAEERERAIAAMPRCCGTCCHRDPPAGDAPTASLCVYYDSVPRPFWRRAREPVYVDEHSGHDCPTWAPRLPHSPAT